MCPLLQLNRRWAISCECACSTAGRFNAVALNARQHRHQRHFNVLEDIQRAFMLLLRPHLQMQLERNVGIFRRVATSLFQRNLVKGELILPCQRSLRR